MPCKRIITTIPVTKPSKEWFVRVHPDQAYRLETIVLELKDDREMYLVVPDLWEALADEPACGPRSLVAAINRKGTPFLWPVPLPGPDGKLDNWSNSAMEAAKAARSSWVRMSSNMGAGSYDVTVATGPIADPEWPDLEFRRRNQPSSLRFICGSARWLRGLIRPDPGRAVAYLDWDQQEFGVAAALSGDQAMMAAYRSGDPYLAFGKQAGRIPPHATRSTHGRERELFKACVLGVQYGMGPETLSGRTGVTPAQARDLLRLHRQSYPRCWAWSDGAESHALLAGHLSSVFGWKIRVAEQPNPRSLRNFPCQANGAEMLRWACCLATERGISVVAPVHDALMIEGPAGAIDGMMDESRRAMAEASEAVLGGFRLRTSARVFRWPERYMDDRGRGF